MRRPAHLYVVVTLLYASPSRHPSGAACGDDDGEPEERGAAVITRSNVKGIAIALLVVGVLFVIMGIVYLTTRSSSLPSFIPGHLPVRVARNGHVIRTHTLFKRGIALLLAAIAVFGVTWWLAFRYEPAD
jgi:hypothetical protein